MRRLPGKFERSANDVQARLLYEYGRWNVVTRRAVLNAVAAGQGTTDIAAIINARVADLRGPMLLTLRAGIARAALLGLGGPLAKYRDNPIVYSLISQRLAEVEKSLDGALLPSMRDRLMSDLTERAVLADASAVKEVLDSQAARVAPYAGSSWAMTFETQTTAVQAEDAARRANGEAPVPVEWSLDERAQHCRPDPTRGTFGCAELEGVYPSVGALPTWPAGNVSCMGNCRCHLRLDFGRGFERIVA